MSEIIGYARCSTSEDKEDIDRQIRELKAAGAQEVVFEYEHSDAKVKRNLQMLLDTAQEGDTIITLELQMIRARVKSGIANAKAKGKQIGRKPLTKEDIPAVFYRHYPAFAAGKMNVSELARVCRVSRPTVYKYLGMIANVSPD